MKRDHPDHGEDPIDINLAMLIREGDPPPVPNAMQRKAILNRLLRKQRELVQRREVVFTSDPAEDSPPETAFSPDSESLQTIYEELRKMAAVKMAGERRDQTLCPTALVNEAFLRLNASGQSFQNKRYFFGAASEAMRRILIEHARRRLACKRGGDAPLVPLEECQVAYAVPLEDEKLLQVHEALDALQQEDETQAEIVKLLIFVGLSQREVAKLLDLSVRTVRRRWAEAKLWLYQHLKAE